MAKVGDGRKLKDFYIGIYVTYAAQGCKFLLSEHCPTLGLDRSDLVLNRSLGRVSPIGAPRQGENGMEERPRAADDYAAIRARMEELKREREAEEKRAKRAAVEEEKLRRISAELRSRVIPRRWPV